MPTDASSVKPPAPPAREFSPLAGLLSYLVPGLGQITQGRAGKGLLFLACIYALFFYGQHLGAGTVRIGPEVYRVPGNVYLPDTAATNNPFNLPALAANLYNRPQFAGQFWVGIAAWPAVWQYLTYDPRQDRRDLGDPFDPGGEADERGGRGRALGTLLGDYQRTPSEEAINAVTTAGDKHIELGWVYTVIAGVLNILVIYDAAAGPAFLLAGAAASGKGGA